MKGNPSALVTPLMISAMRMACSSLSITHGPAIRKRLLEPIRTSPTWNEVDNNLTKNHFTTDSEAQRSQPHRFCLLCVFRDSVVNLNFSSLSSRDFFRTMKHLAGRNFFL